MTWEGMLIADASKGRPRYMTHVTLPSLGLLPNACKCNVHQIAS